MRTDLTVQWIYCIRSPRFQMAVPAARLLQTPMTQNAGPFSAHSIVLTGCTQASKSSLQC